MSQNFSYPSSSTVTVTAIGPNNQPIPTTSILIGGEDPSGDLTPIAVNAQGEIIADIGGAVAGLATEATLLEVDADIQAMSAKLPATLGQKAMAASLAVAIASDQSAIPVSAASLPLPSGAATAANQTSMLARLSGSLVPAAYDEIALTYVTVGNGIGQIETATYKLATVTVKTLTLSYDGSDRLSGVVAS
jgi:hypothetical protein